MYYKRLPRHGFLVIFLTKLREIAKKMKNFQIQTCKKVSLYGTMFYNNLICAKQAIWLKQTVPVGKE